MAPFKYSGSLNNERATHTSGTYLLIAFAGKLDAARGEFLQEELRETVSGLEDNAAV